MWSPRQFVCVAPANLTIYCCTGCHYPQLLSTQHSLSAANRTFYFVRKHVILAPYAWQSGVYAPSSTDIAHRSSVQGLTYVRLPVISFPTSLMVSSTCVYLVLRTNDSEQLSHGAEAMHDAQSAKYTRS